MAERKTAGEGVSDEEMVPRSGSRPTANWSRRTTSSARRTAPCPTPKPRRPTRTRRAAPETSQTRRPRQGSNLRPTA